MARTGVSRRPVARCRQLLVLKAVDHLQRLDSNAEITETVFDELTDTLHCQLGHRALEAWKLPDSFCRVALRHHDDATDTRDPLLVLIQAADAISCRMGMHPKPDPEINLLGHNAIELLNLEDVELATLMADVEDEFWTKTGLFS